MLYCLGVTLVSLCGKLRADVGPGVPLITLRVRLRDGRLRRVSASPTDDLSTIRDQLRAQGQDPGTGFRLDASVENELPLESSLASLSLQHGDILHVVGGRGASDQALSAKKAKLEALKASVDAEEKRKGWQPFPKHARPPPPKGPMSNWNDLEAASAQTYRIKPQKDGRVKELSIAFAVGEGLATAITAVPSKKNSAGAPRCGLLFGTVDDEGEKASVKVEAVYQPSTQLKSRGALYDPKDLLSGVELNRAVNIAGYLGLQPVGWFFSHEKRDHFLSALDISAGAELQIAAMKPGTGSPAGKYFATVTFPIDKASGDVMTEAFTLSDQCVQMWHDGVFAPAEEQPDPSGCTIRVKEVVRDGNAGEETTSIETIGLLHNVAIKQHEGFLKATFPCGGKRSALKRFLLKGKGPFVERLADLQLLVALAGELGVKGDMKTICECVKRKDGSHPSVKKLRTVLDTLLNS
jgi:hypothetical protein